VQTGTWNSTRPSAGTGVSRSWSEPRREGSTRMVYALGESVIKCSFCDGGEWPGPHAMTQPDCVMATVSSAKNVRMCDMSLKLPKLSHDRRQGRRSARLASEMPRRWNAETVRLLGICHRTIRSVRRLSGCQFRQQKPVPTIPKTVGDFLRKKRVEERLSQSEAALRIGVSTSSIKLWELNRTEPAGRFLEQAVTFLDFNPVNGSSKPNSSTCKGVTH
jgi:hypothetical protein